MRIVRQRLLPVLTGTSFSALFCLPVGFVGAADAGSLGQLKAMSLEELASLEVSIVGKKATSVSDTAAAVYVIIRDDILRSTATRLPELLRMVPGLTLARQDVGEWAISSRGFTGRFANKLLVMIDGRSIICTRLVGNPVGGTGSGPRGYRADRGGSRPRSLDLGR